MKAILILFSVVIKPIKSLEKYLEKNPVIISSFFIFFIQQIFIILGNYKHFKIFDYFLLTVFFIISELMLIYCLFVLGKSFNGKADFSKILNSYALSKVPILYFFIIIFLLNIVISSNLRTEIFKNILSYTTIILIITLLIYSPFLLIKYISIVQNISIFKAVLNVFLGIIFFIIIYFFMAIILRFFNIKIF